MRHFNGVEWDAAQECEAGAAALFSVTVSEEMRLSCDPRGAETELQLLEKGSRRDSRKLMESWARRGLEEFETGRPRWFLCQL